MVIIFCSPVLSRLVSLRTQRIIAALKMTYTVFENSDRSQIIDRVVEEAASLFNKRYGVWSKEARGKLGSFTKAG